MALRFEDPLTFEESKSKVEFLRAYMSIVGIYPEKVTHMDIQYNEDTLYADLVFADYAAY